MQIPAGEKEGRGASHDSSVLGFEAEAGTNMPGGESGFGQTKECLCDTRQSSVAGELYTLTIVNESAAQPSSIRRHIIVFNLGGFHL
jgi:hypothetical protein